MPRESVGRRRIRKIDGHWHAEVDGRMVSLTALAPMSPEAWDRAASVSREQLRVQRAVKTRWENGEIYGIGGNDNE